jgi:DNA helicase-2/ATP-dependent DNA helicase PcrA
MSPEPLDQVDDPWMTLAGPVVLGRSILLAKGEAVPSPWRGVARIELNESSLGLPATLGAVRKAYLTRTSVVYEIDTSMKTPGWGSDDREVWQVPVNADFGGEATWRLVRANSVDARDITRPVWPLHAMAIAAGAQLAGGRYADVILPDGKVAWCDGGPTHLWSSCEPEFEGAVIIPRISLAKGLLTPVRAVPPTAVLAPDQLIAVADPAVRARIIAPAGSGKTRVLTERARYVLTAGIPTSSLLLVAFNKRAQEEMRSRTSEFPGLQIQTLNAMALAILNGTNGFESRANRLVTINERDVREIISTYVKFPRKTNTDPAATWIDALTEVRLGLRSPQLVERDYGGDVDGFADFFPIFRRHLADHHQVDFDEQIYLACEVLLREPKVRLAAERRADVLLVDEFQDLTPAHMLLLRLLAGPSLSIFAVGDDDQTIYGFSGATPEWLVEFEEHVPEAVHHALEVNYRCPAPVIAAAANLVSHNTLRVPKEIRPGPNNVASPGALSVAKVDDQVRRTLDHVEQLLEGGAAASDIAVLSRVNANLVPVQVALSEAGIAVNARDGGDFLRNSAVEAALAWLRLAVRPDRLSGNDIMLAARRPGRGFRPQVRTWMGEQATIDDLKMLAGRMDDPTSRKISEFIGDLERIAKLAARATTSSLIEFIRSGMGLDRALATLDVSHQGRNNTSSTDGFRSLIALGRQHPDASTFDAWLRKSLSARQEESGVLLATVHRVKGLEWPHVIVYDVSSTIFPHRLSVDVEEERRVLHVAITRCTTSLLVTADVESPSMFLPELTSLASDRTQRTPEPVSGTSRRELTGRDPISAEPGLKFNWGGYEFTVCSIEEDGVVVSTGASHPTTLPFGWVVKVAGKNRSLIPPTKKSQRNSPSPSVADNDVYRALKAWRLEQARADQVPAFVVFNDRTLEELVHASPRSVADLLRIGGIGPAKAERYGDQILSVIEENLSGGPDALS